MRITLPSGTAAEIAEPSDTDDVATMGLVIGQLEQLRDMRRVPVPGQ